METRILREVNRSKEVQTPWDRSRKVVFGFVLAFALSFWNRSVRNLGVHIILRKLIFGKDGQEFCTHLKGESVILVHRESFHELVHCFDVLCRDIRN